jgi:hypothetical protein
VQWIQYNYFELAARTCMGVRVNRYALTSVLVSMLASGTRVRGLKPGRSRWIFQASEKSSACLPSEGK